MRSIFSRRVPHGLSLDGNCKDGERVSWMSPRFLPENAVDLDLETALGVITQVASQLQRARTVRKDTEEELLDPVPHSNLFLVIG
jgi:hypothetical protein